MNRIFGVGLIVTSAISFGTLVNFGRYTYASDMEMTTMLLLPFIYSVFYTLVWSAMLKDSLQGGLRLQHLRGRVVIIRSSI